MIKNKVNENWTKKEQIPDSEDTDVKQYKDVLEKSDWLAWNLF